MRSGSVRWIESASCLSAMGGILELKLQPQPMTNGTRPMPWVLYVNGALTSRHSTRESGKRAGAKLGREIARSA
jgi:hypothetical protein